MQTSYLTRHCTKRGPEFIKAWCHVFRAIIPVEWVTIINIGLCVSYKNIGIVRFEGWETNLIRSVRYYPCRG